MKEILQKQREYFNTFETYDIKFRIQQLKNLRDKILEKKEDLFAAFKEDMNKSEFEVVSTELGLVMNEINYLIKNIRKLAEDRTSAASILNYPAKNFQIFEPYGLTLVVSPWNYPFQLTLVPVAGAISGGNTVVVKPSRNTPNVTRVIKEILSIFPENYVYVVTEDEKIEGLFDQKFDFIFYTGSGKVGKELLARQSKNVTPMILELGGKCPCVVSKSANIKAAAKRIAFGKFINAGQTCVAPDFVLIDRKVKDKFVAKLIHYIQEFYYKNGVLTEDFVRIINKKQLDNLLERINPTQVVFGGKVDGLTLEPTILDGVTYDDPIMQEEIFGPVLPIIEYDNINDAIAYLRTLPKPLALYYFGSKQKEGAEVLKKCPSGGGCINEVVMHVAEQALPFGGVGESGIGSYHGPKTFYSFVHIKSVLKRSTWFDFGKKYPPYDEKKVKFAKAVFGIKNSKPVKESPIKEPVVEDIEKVEEVKPTDVPAEEFDMIIVPDGEMTLENTVVNTEVEAVEEVIEPAEEMTLNTVETLNESENEEVETVEETKEVVDIKDVEETTEELEKTEPENKEVEEEIVEESANEGIELDSAEEIADIKEQVSTIDREPEDFEEEYVNDEPEIVEELGDEDAELIDEDEVSIQKLEAEIAELENDDTDDDAEQADSLADLEEEVAKLEEGLADVEDVEEVEAPVVEETTDEVEEETVEEPVTEEVSEYQIEAEPVVEEQPEETYVDETETTDEVEEPVEETESENEEVEEEIVVPKGYSSSWGDEVEETPVETKEYESRYDNYEPIEEKKPYRIIDEPKVDEVEEVAEAPVDEVEEPVKKPKKTTAKKSTTKKTTTKKTGEKKTAKKATPKKATKKDEVAEEKPKKTAKKSTPKTTTKKTTTKKATEPKEKKTATPKKEKVVKEKVVEEKVKEEVEVKEPKKKALSKKADAQADAKKAQDDINAMLNMAMPGSIPEKEPVNQDDDFINSLNSLISQNIEKYDDEE